MWSRPTCKASKQEILSEIKGAKNKLTLADAEQALREAEQKLKSDQAADAANVAVSGTTSATKRCSTCTRRSGILPP